jgi:tetratricopeptide (TPR) repeat protein
MLNFQSAGGGGEDISKRENISIGFFDKLIPVSMFMLALGLPIFFTGVTLQGIALDRQIYFYFWLMLGLVAWVSLGVVKGELRIAKTPLDIPILLFLAVYGLSALFSVDKWHSLVGFFGDPSRGFLPIAALVITYYFIFSHFTSKRFIAMAGGFLVSSFIVTVWTVAVVRGLHFMPASWEPYAPLSLLGSVSALGAYFALLLPILLTGLFQTSKIQSQTIQYIARAFLGIMLLAVLFLMIALYSYIPWIALFTGLGFFLIFILSQVVRPGDQWVWLPMLIFVFTLSILMMYRGNASATFSKARLPVEVAPNLTLSWDIAKGALKENFLIGTGPATYGYNFAIHKPETFNQTPFYTVRFYEGSSALFETLTTIGVIGMIAFVIVILSFLSIGLYLLTREREQNKMMSLALWSSAVTFLIIIFTVRVNGPTILIGSFLSIMALRVLLWESQSEQKWLNLSFKATPKFALTLAFLFMVVSAGVAAVFVFMGKLYMADMYAGRAVRAASPSIEGSLTDLNQALNYYPKESRYFTRAGHESLALTLAEMNKGEGVRNLDLARRFANDAINATMRGAELMPKDVAAVESVGVVYENLSLLDNAYLPKAKEQYETASALDPRNPLLLLKIAQIDKALADQKGPGDEAKAFLADATNRLNQAIALKDDFAVAYHTLAIIQAGNKDFEGAVDSEGKAVARDPKNLTYIYSFALILQARDKDGDADQAEKILKAILASNEKLVDVRVSLGVLYEKQKNMQEAIKTYQKALDAIPSDSDRVANLRTQVEKMLATVKGGGTNIGKQAPSAQAPSSNPPVAVPEVPVSPVNPSDASIQESIPQP